MQCNVLDKDTSHNVFSTEHVVFSLLATLSGNIGSANRLWAQITRVPVVAVAEPSGWILLNQVEASDMLSQLDEEVYDVYSYGELAWIVSVTGDTYIQWFRSIGSVRDEGNLKSKNCLSGN